MKTKRFNTLILQKLGQRLMIWRFHLKVKHFGVEMETTENDSFLSTSSHIQPNESVAFPPLPLSIAQCICKKNKTVQCKPIYKTSCVQAVTTTKLKCVQVSETSHVHLYGVQTTKVKEDKLPRKKCSRGERLKNRLFLDADFETFAQKLHENEQTDIFVKCISMLTTGKLPFTNMSWKCFLDVGTLLSCTSTTNMEYYREWLEFCQVLYHMFGVGVINALRGRGHFSQVACKKNQKRQVRSCFMESSTSPYPQYQH